MFERINKRLENFFCLLLQKCYSWKWRNLEKPVWLSSVFFTWWSPPRLVFLESSSCSLPSQTCWFLPSFFLASSGSCGASFFLLTRCRGFRIQSKSVATLAIARVSSSLRGSRAPPDSESTFAILFCGTERIDTRQESQSVFCHILDSWCVRCSCIASPLVDLFYSVVFFYVFFFVLLSQQFSILPQDDLLFRLTNQWQQCLQLRGVCSPWCIHFCVCGSRNQDQGGRGGQSSIISSYNDSIAVALFVISDPEARSSLCISVGLIPCILSPIPSLILCLCNALLMLCTVVLLPWDCQSSSFLWHASFRGKRPRVLQARRRLIVQSFDPKNTRAKCETSPAPLTPWF